MKHANNPLLDRIPQRGLFITGSDTEIGKTYLSVGLLLWLQENGVRTGAYKPVASGISQPSEADHDPFDDIQRLSSACDQNYPLEMICPQRFRLPLAPCLAAEHEGKIVNEDLLREGATAWKDVVDFLLVEGAGGLLSPLSFQYTNLELAKSLGYPVMIVVPNRLGAVNQALLTCMAADSQGLRIAGLVFNDCSKIDDEKAQEIRFEQHKRLYLSTASRMLSCTLPPTLHGRFGGFPEWKRLNLLLND